MSEQPPSPYKTAALYVSVFLISAAGLAYQVVLMRVLAIAQWHHFAYLIVSMAMLGFGASGTVLALARKWVMPRAESLYIVTAWLLAVSMVACYAISQQIPFETFEIVSQRSQLLHLSNLYLVLALPFFLMATCIALTFFILPNRIGYLYGANLGGSGVGALGVAMLLYVYHPVTLAHGVALAVVIAFVLPLISRKRAFIKSAVGIAALAVIVIAIGIVPIRVSQYKGLSYVQDFPDAEKVAQAWSPNAVIDAVQSSMVRETPGQIGNYPMSEMGRLPAQIGLYFDAGGMSPVNEFDGNFDDFAYLDYVTSALAYRLVDNPRTLVVGAGGGTDVIGALAHGAQHVTAVDVDPNVFGLVNGPLGDFSGQLYNRDDVTPLVADGRGFLAANPDQYDLIKIAMLDSFTASAAGVFALNESYLYTREALGLYINRLTPDGMLVITRWLKTPARDALKLFATAVEACETQDIQNPSDHLVFLRSLNNALILVSKSPLDESDIATVREFATSRGFDTCYFPGITEDEVNRYTLLERPVYYEFAQGVLFGDRDQLYDDALFHLRPATDDSPYFFRFFRWKSLPVLTQAMGAQWVPFVEWGYITLVACLIQALIAGVVLILLPLIGKRTRGAPKGMPTNTIAGFAAIGLAFMFMEIAFMQRLMLFLTYPIYGIAVVLAGLLVFTGIGSYASGRIDWPASRTIRFAVIGIAVLSILYILALGPLFNAFMDWPDPAKIALALALLAPLGFCMGVPFPTGLQTLSDRYTPLMPWAWGINGCASVLGPPLATLIAIHFGFRLLVLAALILYALAALTLTRLATSPIANTFPPK